MPLTKLAFDGMMPQPVAPPPTPMPMPTSAPAPMPPAQSPPLGIAGTGGGGTKAPSQSVPGMTPGSGKAFKTACVKVAFTPIPYPPIQQQQPRTGIINAAVDTGKDYLDGLGQYSLDVLNENSHKTQRPNDPRVMSRSGGTGV